VTRPQPLEMKGDNPVLTLEEDELIPSLMLTLLADRAMLEKWLYGAELYKNARRKHENANKTTGITLDRTAV